jgi:hypothetical protein
MGWPGHAARMRVMRNSYEIFDEIIKERDHVGDLAMNMRICPREVRICTGFIWLRIWFSGGFL